MAEKSSFGALFRASFFEAPSLVLAEALLTLASIVSWILGWSNGADPRLVFMCYSIALVIVVNAVYRHGKAVWSRERDSRIETESKIKKDLPEFVGFIDWVTVFEGTDGQCPTLVVINVTNSGTPSILQTWRIQLTTEDGVVLELPKATPLQHEVLEFLSGENTVSLVKGSDFINFKTHPNGIERGHGARGILMCNIPAGLKPAWKIAVTFRDVTGRIYGCEFQPSLAPDKRNDLSSLGGWSGLDIRHRKKETEPGLPSSGS